MFDQLRVTESSLKKICLANTVLPIIIAIALSGCGKSASVTGNGTGASGSFGGDVVATVNDQPITQSQMYDQMVRYVPSQVQGFPQSPVLEQPAGKVALQNLIESTLLLQLASDHQVPVTSDEVDARYMDVKMVKEAQSTQTFEQLLNDQGYTPQEFKSSNIQADVAQYNLISLGVTASPAEYLAYYNTHKADYTEANRVHLARVVLADKASADAAYEQAQKDGRLDGILTQNISPPIPGGDSSADIPQWISLDTPQPALKPILTEAGSAQIGAILKPVQVQGQWWVAQVVDKRTRAVIPYSQVQHIVQWNVLSRKALDKGNAQQIGEELQQKTQQANITVTDPSYESVIQQLKAPIPSNPMMSAPSSEPPQPGKP